MFIRYNNPKLKQQILEDTKKNIARRGGLDKLLIVKTNDTTFVGKNLLEISQFLKTTPEKIVLKILRTGYARVASFNMNSNDILNFMVQDRVVTGSDGNTGRTTQKTSVNTFYRNRGHFIYIQIIGNGT